MNNEASIINPESYHNAVTKLRDFFVPRGFIEVPTQSRLSILAACEDPETIAQYNYGGKVWPLPQTGQMWLEYELLKNPDSKGFFCISTSYRQEPHPIEGRHETIFPMFEFEMPGHITDLLVMERELLHHLGFKNKYNEIHIDFYTKLAERVNTKILEAEHEKELAKTLGNAFMICDFPLYTSPFWNMKVDGDVAKKIDVIMCGMETIGSAERSSDKEQMDHLFHTISDGKYASILYDRFGKARVEAELNEFLSYDFFERVGGGIGITRLIRALSMNS
jgi:aspartyl/asparaginyl-tRNA synthetase